MKNMEIKNIGLDELSLSEQQNVNGGVLPILWGMVWSGMKIGLAVGGAIGVAYYFSK